MSNVIAVCVITSLSSNLHLLCRVPDLLEQKDRKHRAMAKVASQRPRRFDHDDTLFDAHVPLERSPEPNLLDDGMDRVCRVKIAASPEVSQLRRSSSAARVVLTRRVARAADNGGCGPPI